MTAPSRPARAEEEPSPTGYPPVWVEDASEANLDELHMELHDEGEGSRGTRAVEADEAIEADEAVEASKRTRLSTMSRPPRTTIPDRAFDEAIDVPFAWEDVQDALEALDEDVLTGAD